MSQSFKVFAVDDDPVVLDIVHAILEPDCQLQTFASAEDCLVVLESEKPDLFYLDVNLPGMDGYAFCRHIKNDPALRNTPVTFVSGRDTHRGTNRGVRRGRTGLHRQTPSNPRNSCANSWWRRTWC